MKNLSFIFFGLSLICFVSCNDDLPDADLAYDSENADAPFLLAGTYQACARFTSAETSTLSGTPLSSIDYYFANLPQRAEVKVFGEGTTTSPGDELYSSNVTLASNTGWNTHQVAGEVEITGGDIWICLELLHDSEINTIGCDAGPADPDGDWLFSDLDNEWQSFRQRTNQNVSINWNIRANVE
jgi:hypothetical protein